MGAVTLTRRRVNLAEPQENIFRLSQCVSWLWSRPVSQPELGLCTEKLAQPLPAGKEGLGKSKRVLTGQAGVVWVFFLTVIKRTRGFGLSPLISLQRRNADKHDAASVKDGLDCRKVVLTRI